jgi:hypothetical protein
MMEANRGGARENGVGHLLILFASDGRDDSFPNDFHDLDVT